MPSTHNFKKLTKPQNQISEQVKKEVKGQLMFFLVSLGVSGYHSGLIAQEMLNRAMSERVRATDPTAPDVYLTDKDKIESLVMASKRMVDSLDESGELETLLEELIVRDSQGEGNSI